MPRLCTFVPDYLHEGARLRHMKYYVEPNEKLSSEKVSYESEFEACHNATFVETCPVFPVDNFLIPPHVNHHIR